MPTSDCKIFGIGLSKTGTTSLSKALEMLGYRTKDNPGLDRYTAGDLSCIDSQLLDEYDAFTDTPIPSFYRELDARYPHSKFILTVRDRAGWLKSCQKQFTARLAAKQNEAHNRLFTDLYDSTVFDEEKFSCGYDRFVGGVLEYFRDRPDDLLVLDVAAGEGWEKLCAFLGVPVPDALFPKSNVTQIRWIKVEDLVAIAREAGRASLKIQRGGWTRKIGKALGIHRDDIPVIDRATDAADRIISRGLEKLAPRIPVVSRIHPVPPFSDRKHWNHCWLIDPLDGDGRLATGSSFSVNIALIEDGCPIYGVVYAPVEDIVYFARAGHGGYRQVRDGGPAKLEEAEQAAGIRQEQTGSLLGCALVLCGVADGATRLPFRREASREWHTAAAQAILATVGRRVVDCETGVELACNKESLANSCFIVR